MNPTQQAAKDSQIPVPAGCSFDELMKGVCATANFLLTGKRHIKLLEAGCGSATHIKFNADVYAVGIDISREQLEKNDMVQEKILGDIQDCILPEREFDVVICWTVLEHLSKPKDALLNIFHTIKPQGLLILAFPNLLSIKGLLTKITPFWFHEAFYRFVWHTGRPFPTYLRLGILPRRVIQLAQDHGFSVEFCKLVQDPVWERLRTRSRFIDLTFSAVDSATRLVPFGKVRSPVLDNCVMILRNRQAGTAV